MKTNEQIRVTARGKLQGQWTMVALLLLASGILGQAVQRLFDAVIGFPENSWQETSLLFLLNVLLLFAFEFGGMYLGLVVARGGKAQLDQIFAVFNGRYYFSMMGINFVQALILKLTELIIFLPVLLFGGAAAFWGMLNIGNNSEFDWAADLSGGFTALIVAVILVLLLVLVFLQMIISGAFQFAVYSKFDAPELSVKEAIRVGWRRYQPHIKQYIWLELSMIPYLLAGLLVFCIGIFWPIAWVTVAEAEFYEAAKAEEMTDF